MSRKLRTYHELAGEDRSRLGAQVAAQKDRVAARLASVAHVVAVMSGKGGVGKSFVTSALALGLARSDRSVGVLDADLHGPTAARMLGAKGALVVEQDAVRPVSGQGGVRVMSTELLLEDGAPLQWKEPGGDGFIWRGALEAGMLREFLGDVAWGDLDVLLVDLPPGSERLAALMQLAPKLSGVLAVTIPSDASRRAVARSLEVARGAGAPILGIVENMTGMFTGDAAAVLARDFGAQVLASIPFEAAAQQSADAGALPEKGPAAEAARRLVTAVARRLAL